MLSEGLRIHLQATLSTTLSAWPGGDEETVAAVSQTVVRNIEALTCLELEDSVPKRQLNKKCMENAELVTRHLRNNVGQLSACCQSVEEVKRIVDLEVEKISLNTKIFEDISSHHRDMRHKTWGDTLSGTGELAAYAEAATKMGEKRWVQQANSWIRQSCYRFFCLGGARKAFAKAAKKPNGNRVDMTGMVLSDDLMGIERRIPTDGENPPRSKIRVLDVGACYNPLVEEHCSLFSNEAAVPSDSFDVLGVDLYPANASVLQCDFLNVSISSASSSVQTAPASDFLSADTEEYRRVVSLPSESYEAVTMCLVLSYLPDPLQRLKMVENARKLLISPSNADDSEPHRTGILVIAEKVSVFGNGPKSRSYINEWRDVIQGAGFDMVSAQILSSAGNQAYGMIFRKVSDTNFWIPSSIAGLHTMVEKRKSSSDPSGNNCEELDCGRKRVKKDHTGTHMLNKNPVSTVSGPLLHVAIVGGGIGGFALAAALQKVPYISFMLYEKDESFSCRKQGSVCCA